MGVPTIRETASIEANKTELIYSIARLQTYPIGKPYVKQYEALEKRFEAATVERDANDRAKVIAQAQVDAADDALDDWTARFAAELGRIAPRTSARFRLYFSRPPSELIRLGLESQMKLMEEWPERIAKEPEPAMSKLGKELVSVFRAGAAALKLRSKAFAAGAEYTARVQIPLTEDHNAVRLATFGAMASAAAKDRKLGRDFPSRFFRRVERAGPSEVPPPDPLPSAETSQVA